MFCTCTPHLAKTARGEGGHLRILRAKRVRLHNATAGYRRRDKVIHPHQSTPPNPPPHNETDGHDILPSALDEPHTPIRRPGTSPEDNTPLRLRRITVTAGPRAGVHQPPLIQEGCFSALASIQSEPRQEIGIADMQAGNADFQPA